MQGIFFNFSYLSLLLDIQYQSGKSFTPTPVLTQLLNSRTEVEAKILSV